MNHRISRFIRFLGGIAMRLLIAICVGMLLLTVAYALPREPIRENVAASAPIFSQDDGSSALSAWYTCSLDNFTDALMLLEAACDNEGSPFQRAILAATRGWTDDVAPSASIVNQFMKGIKYDEISYYIRYWHGYHVLLNPLLLLFNYGQIRGLNALFQILTVALVLYMMIRKKLVRLALPYLLSYFLLMPWALAKSLQYSACFYLFSFGCISVIALGGSRPTSERCLFLFFWIGAATSYFDFLTYPIATFGIPAAVWLALLRRPRAKPAFKTLCALLALWGIGYVGMWSGKWLIATLFTEYNGFKEAFGSILFRSAKKSFQYLLDTYSMNLTAFIHTPVFTAFCCFCIACLLFAVWNFIRCRKLRLRAPAGSFCFSSYLLLALLPFIWYTGATNHSYDHAWFTNKACVVTAFACMSMFAQLLHIQMRSLRRKRRPTDKIKRPCTRRVSFRPFNS